MARPTVTEYLADGTRRMHMRDIGAYNESANSDAFNERSFARLEVTPIRSASIDIAERRRNTMEFTFARFRMLAENPECLRDMSIEELATSAMWAASNDPQASPRARRRAERNLRAYTHILQNLRGVGNAVVSLTNFDEFANRNRDENYAAALTDRSFATLRPYTGRDPLEIPDAAALPDDEPTHSDREATEELVASTAEHREPALDLARELGDETEALKACYLAVLTGKMERLEQRVENGSINEATYKRRADRLMDKYNRARAAFGMESDEEEEEGVVEEEQRMRAPLTPAEREQFRTVMEQEEQEMEAEEEEEVEVD